MLTLERGAEAVVSAADFLGREAVVKARRPKSYRDPQLDLSLRSARTRKEARLLQAARRAGVRTPYVYDIDMREASITMEMVRGPRLRDILSPELDSLEQVCSAVGEALAKLHRAGISHGDLTTSNMILADDGLCLIDFSLGSMPASVEDLGVDVHLLRRAFMSAHSDIHWTFEALIDGYRRGNPAAEAALAKADDIQSRGRYT